MELEQLIKLVETVSRSELTGFKYEENGVKLHIQKEKKILAPTERYPAEEFPVLQTEPVEEIKTPEQIPDGKIVESPLVGTFYTAPAEDARPFVSPGDHVKKGQTLAIVEAMKLMNEIESEYEGTVQEVLAENGQSVEYGQPLFRIC